jgi:hypothetical protein
VLRSRAAIIRNFLKNWDGSQRSNGRRSRSDRDFLEKGSEKLITPLQSLQFHHPSLSNAGFLKRIKERIASLISE